MNRIRQLFAILIAAAAACCGIAQAQLVSEQEAAESRAAPERFTAKAIPAPDAPRIRVVAPNVSNPVASPTQIQVQFQPTSPALIRPDTFRVLYGSFRIDITDRITASSKVTAQGIDVAEAKLPKGSHKLFIEIQDSAGRTGQSPLQFVVE
jgi:hypothetical protein